MIPAIYGNGRKGLVTRVDELEKARDVSEGERKARDRRISATSAGLASVLTGIIGGILKMIGIL